MAHWSDCSVNNAPALPTGPCDCGNDAPEPASNVVYGVDFRAKAAQSDNACSEINPDSGDCA